ncbi:MAG TPA: respiratory nitrate reductase subunit gamma [Spirochaetia bacterium]|nr:respiratory nitrate reductase subunit gamma [Spirochaetia bacterium]
MADALSAATNAAANAAVTAVDTATSAISSATANAAAAQGGAEALSAATSLPPTGVGLVLARISWFIVVPGVYIALGFGLAAIVVRLVKIFRSPPPPWQLAIYPEVSHPRQAALRDAFGMGQIRKQAPLFWIMLVIFHLGLLGIFLGHLDILPEISIVSESSRDMLGAGVFGLMVTIPIFYFIGRRFRSPVREVSTPGDYILLLLLLFTFLFGDLMSWGNSWTAQGFVMTKADFAQYFDGLLKFKFEDPRTYLHGTHYHFLVIHVLLAEAVLVTLPFTKVIHAFLSVPANILRRRTWNRK